MWLTCFLPFLTSCAHKTKLIAFWLISRADIGDLKKMSRMITHITLHIVCTWNIYERMMYILITLNYNRNFNFILKRTTKSISLPANNIFYKSNYLFQCGVRHKEFEIFFQPLHFKTILINNIIVHRKIKSYTSDINVYINTITK